MKRIQKPIGIYVMTILIFLGLGALQLLGYLTTIANANGEAPFPIVFVSVFVCMFSGAAAVWAFYGDNLARICLLVFVTGNVMWLAFLIILAISYPTENDKMHGLGLIPVLVRPAFWLCLTWWYFTKADVVAYYRQESERAG